MSAAPELVFVDPRVASRMNQDGGDDLIGYIRQDVYENAIRTSRGVETIVQLLTNPEGRLIGLSSWGRVFAFISPTKDVKPDWKLMSEALPAPELDS